MPVEVSPIPFGGQRLPYTPMFVREPTVGSGMSSVSGAAIPPTPGGIAGPHRAIPALPEAGYTAPSLRLGAHSFDRRIPSQFGPPGQQSVYAGGSVYGGGSPVFSHAPAHLQPLPSLTPSEGWSTCQFQQPLLLHPALDHPLHHHEHAHEHHHEHPHDHPFEHHHDRAHDHDHGHTHTHTHDHDHDHPHAHPFRRYSGSNRGGGGGGMVDFDEAASDASYYGMTLTPTARQRTRSNSQGSHSANGGGTVSAHAFDSPYQPVRRSASARRSGSRPHTQSREDVHHSPSPPPPHPPQNLASPISPLISQKRDNAPISSSPLAQAAPLLPTVRSRLSPELKAALRDSPNHGVEVSASPPAPHSRNSPPMERRGSPASAVDDDLVAHGVTVRRRPSLTTPSEERVRRRSHMAGHEAESSPHRHRRTPSHHHHSQIPPPNRAPSPSQHLAYSQGLAGEQQPLPTRRRANSLQGIERPMNELVLRDREREYVPGGTESMYQASLATGGNDQYDDGASVAGSAMTFLDGSVGGRVSQYGLPQYGHRMKPDYRRFCVQRGNADVYLD